MRLALDTNAYAALDAGNDVIADFVRRAEVIGVPLTVLGELHFGFLNGNRLVENAERLDRFLAVPRVQVLPVDATTARLFGEIAVGLRRIGRTIQQDDLWIAATCKQHDYVLATNDQGFSDVVGLGVVHF